MILILMTQQPQFEPVIHTAVECGGVAPGCLALSDSSREEVSRRPWNRETLQSQMVKVGTLKVGYFCK